MSLTVVSYPLPFFSDRPQSCIVDVIVLHAMFDPAFIDEQRFELQRCADLLSRHKVSSHYLISPVGAIWQCVDECKRAWHAGESKMPFVNDERMSVGDFSIGIELLGDWTDITYEYPDAQYSALIDLTNDIIARNQIREIVGHDEIAPGRKSDPGQHFDWSRYLSGLTKSFRRPGSAIH